MFVSVWRHLPMHDISKAVSPCWGCWRLSFCMSNLRTCWPGNIFSSLLWLFERRFAQNLAFGGNQALRIPLKVIWVTPKSQKGQISHFCWDPFWRHFSIISDVFFVRFFDALQDGHFSDVGAKLGPKPGLLRDVFTTFWAQAEPVKIVLSCGFWQGSEGWRHSHSDGFSKMFVRACQEPSNRHFSWF